MHIEMILPGAFGLRSAAIVSLSLRLGGLIRFVVVILHHARQVLVDLESFRHFVQNDQLIKGRIADRAKQLKCLPDRFLHKPIMAVREHFTAL